MRLDLDASALCQPLRQCGIVGQTQDGRGKITGGVGMATIAASMFFAAISGSGPATVSAMGTIMLPEMEKRGYDKGFSTGLTATAGTIGVIIPPSIPFVIYSVVTIVPVFAITFIIIVIFGAGTDRTTRAGTRENV